MEIAKKHLYVAAPFKEDPARFAPGHKHRFDDDFLATLRGMGASTSVVESAAWDAHLDPLGQMFRGLLPHGGNSRALCGGCQAEPGTCERLSQLTVAVARQD